MQEAQYILQNALQIMPYSVPTIISISVVIVADVIYYFLYKTLRSAKSSIRWK